MNTRYPFGVQPNALNSNILKVSHHGSIQGTYLFSLQRIRPVYAIISCPPNNIQFPNPFVTALIRNGPVPLRSRNIQSINTWLNIHFQNGIPNWAGTNTGGIEHTHLTSEPRTGQRPYPIFIVLIPLGELVFIALVEHNIFSNFG